MFRAWSLFVPALMGLVGCMSTPTSRSQSEDEPKPETGVRTVGDVTAFSNVQPLVISGVGLVYGLDGTGHSPPGFFRDMLERELKKDGCRTPSEYLDSPNQAMVLVSAVIPAGARKGDPLDIQVSLPDGSKATSLRGGQLYKCRLVPFDTASNISARVAENGGDRLLMGNTMAMAEGTLVFDPRENPTDADGEAVPVSERVARIWKGGTLLEERPLYLTLHSENQRARFAAQIAGRVNERFHGNARSEDVAVAKTKEVVLLRVPPQYRLNMPRFMRAVRMIPLETVPAEDKYWRELEEKLFDPAETVAAALRLEGLGSDSKDALRSGLDSPYPLVRFSCAESLAYLGDPSGAKELARLATEHVPLQAYCLTALASLSEPVSILRLQEMLNDGTPELRYSAFRALRELDPRLTLIRGESLDKEFWMHRLAPGSDDMIHVRTGERAEVALFGGDQKLRAPFAILVGDYTITAGEGDEQCKVSRFSARHGKEQKLCRFDVSEVLRAMTELGADYGDALTMLRQADREGVLNCPLVEDAKPGAADVYQLAEMGRDDPTLSRVGELAKGETPTLYEE